MINLLIPGILLSLFGVFTLFGINVGLFFHQLIFVVVAFAAFIAVKKIGLPVFRSNSKLLYWIFIVALIVTYIVGLEVKGSRRWLDFGLFNFQASEFFKAFFILFLAEHLTKRYIKHNSFDSFLKSIAYFILPTFIIFKQPDLGNALVFFFIFFTMVLFSDYPKRYIIYSMFFLFLTIPFGWLFMKGYQRDRILSFLSPHLDTQGTAYNMIQAVITIGSGKFFGRGLGLGTQSRLFFLPENHTDFAFASLVEQFGFLGGLAVLVLYAVIIYLLIQRAVKFYFQRDEEGKKRFLYTIGVLSYLVFQIFVNMGMNLGILPVAGIALPFISYGGSSIAALLIAFALIP